MSFRYNLVKGFGYIALVSMLSFGSIGCKKQETKYVSASVTREIGRLVDDHKSKAEYSDRPYLINVKTKKEKIYTLSVQWEF